MEMEASLTVGKISIFGRGQVLDSILHGKGLEPKTH